MLVSVLVKIKFGHAQISVAKIGILMSRHNGMLRYIKNRYTEINEGRNKKTKENDSNKESKRSKTNNERQSHQSRKGIDKWQEELDSLKSDVCQIKEYIKAIMANKE